ncbi:MAG: PAS domain S-box protein, partial [Cytophagaceae bacterium]|nr:PAS domain S-box protein [Cytophagaceae bacterium]
ELPGKNLEILIPPKYREGHRKGTERFLKTRQPKLIGHTVEVEGLKKDGKIFPIELSLSAWSEDNIYFFCGIIRDISEKHKLLREMEVLQAISIAISKSEDFNAALKITIRLICEYADWDCGEAWIPNADKTEISYAPVWYISEDKYSPFVEESISRNLKPGEGMPGRVFNNAVEWAPDISKHASGFARRSTAESVGLKAGLGVPITNYKGEVFAALLFYFHEAKESDIVFTKIVISLATQLGTFLEKKQAEDALLKMNLQLEEEVKKRTEELSNSEERYKTFVHQSSEGIFRFECSEKYCIDTSLPEKEQMRIFYEHAYLAECNDAMAKMYGFSSNEEIVGARLGDFLPPDDPDVISYLKSFMQNNYRIIDAESR